VRCLATYSFAAILQFCLLAVQLGAQNIIDTAAGNGIAGFSGDGGTATSALIDDPSGVAVDASGNLYIADTDNLRVRKVNLDGVISTVAGNGVEAFSGDGGPATAASLGFVTGVALDAIGNLYIADGTNARVRKVDQEGTISTIAGNGVEAFSGDGGPATSASLNRPSGVAVDAAGNIYIGDSRNSRIRKVDAGGIITTVAGNGASGFSGDGGPANAASLAAPRGVMVDAAGNLYIADMDNSRIRKVDAGGIITTVAGNGVYGFSGDGGPATAASLAEPRNTALDASGNLYIADKDNKRVRIWPLAWQKLSMIFPAPLEPLPTTWYFLFTAVLLSDLGTPDSTESEEHRRFNLQLRLGHPPGYRPGSLRRGVASL